MGHKLYVGSLKGAWRLTGSNGSGNRACRSSKMYGLSLRSCRCYWIFLGSCWWELFWWWLISTFEKVFECLNLIGKIYVYYNILQ